MMDNTLKLSIVDLTMAISAFTSIFEEEEDVKYLHGLMKQEDALGYKKDCKELIGDEEFEVWAKGVMKKNIESAVKKYLNAKKSLTATE